MNSYNLISENEESTVVVEYISDKKGEEDWYQSEAVLEKVFIKQLQSQSYQYLNINNEKDLIDNFGLQLEKLNDYKFSDNEWKFFLI